MILKSFYRNNNYFPSLNKFVNLPKKLHYHDDYGQRMYIFIENTHLCTKNACEIQKQHVFLFFSEHQRGVFIS